MASRIQFKILATLTHSHTHKFLTHTHTHSPCYLYSLLNHYSYQLTRQSTASFVQFKSPTTTLKTIFAPRAAPLIWNGLPVAMSGHHLPFRLSRKCSKLIISAVLPPSSRSALSAFSFRLGPPGPRHYDVLQFYVCFKSSLLFYIFYQRIAEGHMRRGGLDLSQSLA